MSEDPNQKNTFNIGNMTVKLSQNSNSNNKNRQNLSNNDRYYDKDKYHQSKNYYNNRSYTNKHNDNKYYKKNNYDYENKRKKDYSNDKRKYSRSRSNSHHNTHHTNKNINKTKKQSPKKANDESFTNNNNNQKYSQKHTNPNYNNNYHKNINQNIYEQKKNFNNNNNKNPEYPKNQISTDYTKNIYNKKQNTQYQNYLNLNQQSTSEENNEPSNTLLITDLPSDITKETLEEIFNEKCLLLQTSMPIDIRIIEALGIAYIIFPSVNNCITVFNSLQNNKININNKFYSVNFSPNLVQNSYNRDTMTYVKEIDTDPFMKASMETTVHEDWYCVYCDCKNFSRRVVCFKCQKPKTLNCRVVPVIKQKKIIVGKNGEILPSTSIIVQGNQVKFSDEGEVFKNNNIILF